MAYSMFECPKLHNAKSLKFYPEEYDHHVSFRHKNLPPDFELTVENYANHNTKHNTKDEDKTNLSVQAQTSSYKKCPIYIHDMGKIRQNEGDFVPKNSKKIKSKQRSVIAKLEETYWANWKPDKTDVKKSKSKLPAQAPVLKSSKSPEIQVIKSAPERRRKIRVYPYPEDIQDSETQIESKETIQQISSRSQEIQTDEIPQTGDVPSTPKKDESSTINDSVEENPDANPSEEVVPDNKFLKHTDSFILNIKKQKEEKEHFDQPKCIRLYRKPGKISSKNFVKGGSYPLKSCLKKESNFTKTSMRLRRPGSPVIVSSNFNARGKYGKSNHRH